MAAAVDQNGGLLGVESFPASETGFEGLLAWLVGFGPVSQIGVEGTGSWGVGLTRFLHDQEIVVIEVDRPTVRNDASTASRIRPMRWRRLERRCRGRRR